jgi:hypothetical protein
VEFKKQIHEDAATGNFKFLLVSAPTTMTDPQGTQETFLLSACSINQFASCLGKFCLL